MKSPTTLSAPRARDRRSNWVYTVVNLLLPSPPPPLFCDEIFAKNSTCGLFCTVTHSSCGGTVDTTNFLSCEATEPSLSPPSPSPPSPVPFLSLSTFFVRATLAPSKSRSFSRCAMYSVSAFCRMLLRSCCGSPPPLTS